MSSSKLESFLAQQFADGDHDSEGQFTVTAEKAFEKLSSATLTKELDWVLKVVQAAVAGKVEALDLRRSSQGLFVDFYGLQEVPELSRLESLIYNTGLPLGSFEGELMVGLRTLMFAAPFVVSVKSGQSLWWDGKAFQEDEIEPFEADFTIWVMQKSWSVFAASKHSKLLSLVMNRAIYAPITLRLDSVNVTPEETLGRRLADRDSFSMDWSLPLIHAAIGPSAPPDETTESWNIKRRTPFKNRLQTPGFLLSYNARPEGSPIFFHSWLAYQKFGVGVDGRPGLRILPGRFTVVFTRLGVNCGGTSFTSPVQGNLVVEANSARTDLSGLQIQLPRVRQSVPLFAVQTVRALHDQLVGVVLGCETNRSLGRNDLFRGVVGTFSTTAVLTVTMLCCGLLLPGSLTVGATLGALVGGATVQTGSKPLSPEQITALAEALREFTTAIGDDSFYEQDWAEGVAVKKKEASAGARP